MRKLGRKAAPTGEVEELEPDGIDEAQDLRHYSIPVSDLAAQAERSEEYRW